MRHATDHPSITHLGGTGGSGWCWSKQQVIVSINAGTKTFFTLEAGKRADVRVVADGKWTNYLLALPPGR